MIIIAVHHKKGNYQGKDYDNIVFTCFDDLPSSSLLCGAPVVSLKVKTDLAIDCLGKSVSSIDWQRFAGSDLICQFNRFGQVTTFCVNFQDGGTVDLATTTEGPDPDSAMSEPSDSKDNKGKSSKKSS